MKAASLSKLRDELKHLPNEVVLDLLVRIIKYKKENKELLSYLLFEADDDQTYVENIKLEIDSFFRDVNRRQISQSKKVLQKALRTIGKYPKYSGSKRIDADIHIYFCQKMVESGILRSHNTTIANIYQRQIVRINKALATLHPDLQYDYQEIIEQLSV